MQEATFTHEELLALAFSLHKYKEFLATRPTPFLDEIERKLSALVNDNDKEAPDFKISVIKK